MARKVSLITVRQTGWCGAAVGSLAWMEMEARLSTGRLFSAYSQLAHSLHRPLLSVVGLIIIKTQHAASGCGREQKPNLRLLCMSGATTTNNNNFPPAAAAASQEAARCCLLLLRQEQLHLTDARTAGRAPQTIQQTSSCHFPLKARNSTNSLPLTHSRSHHKPPAPPSPSNSSHTVTPDHRRALRHNHLAGLPVSEPANLPACLSPPDDHKVAGGPRPLHTRSPFLSHPQPPVPSPPCLPATLIKLRTTPASWSKQPLIRCSR